MGEQRYTAEQIADIAGVDAESLKMILKQRPSFTTRWHQGFNIVIENVRTASIQLELVIPGESDKSSIVCMDTPMMLDQLLCRERMTIDEVFTLHRESVMDATLSSTTSRKTLPKSNTAPTMPHVPLSHGPFDVDTQLMLWGLKEYHPAKGSGVRVSAKQVKPGNSSRAQPKPANAASPS